jgi:hypothetical membrane protein
MQGTRGLLVLGIAVPLLYFGTLIVAASTWPEYSHVTRYASELGGPEAPKPWIFNGGIIVMGIACVLAAVGLGQALYRISARRALSILAGVCVGLFGVGMLMGGVFPMPNPLHGGFGLAFAIVPAPAFMAMALLGVPGFAGLRAVLWIGTVAMITTLAIMMGVGHLVTRANVGVWQRINALAMFPWLGVAAWWLRRALSRSVPAHPHSERGGRA